MQQYIDQLKAWIANNKTLAYGIGGVLALVAFWKLRKKMRISAARRRAAAKARRAKKRKRRAR